MHAWVCDAAEPVHSQAFPRHGYTFAYPELLLTSAQRVFVSHKSKYQLKLFVTTILAKMNVVQAEDARSRAWPCSYERHVCEKLGLSPQESDMNRIHVALLRRDPRSKSGNQLESRAIAMVAACAVTPSYGASRHRSRTEICVFLHVHVTCVVA